MINANMIAPTYLMMPNRLRLPDLDKSYIIGKITVSEIKTAMIRNGMIVSIMSWNFFFMRTLYNRRKTFETFSKKLLHMHDGFAIVSVGGDYSENYDLRYSLINSRVEPTLDPSSNGRIFSFKE